MPEQPVSVVLVAARAMHGHDGWPSWENATDECRGEYIGLAKVAIASVLAQPVSVEAALDDAIRDCEADWLLGANDDVILGARHRLRAELERIITQATASAAARARRERDAEFQQMRRMLGKLENIISSEAESITYGFFPGGDPREFTCDPECSTEEERAAHATDCEAWNAWEAMGETADPPALSVKHGHSTTREADGTVVSVKWAGYGLGTCRWVDKERAELAEEIRRALPTAARTEGEPNG